MRDYREEDRRVRERLERQSSGGRRADVAGMINAVSENDVVLQRSAGDILLGLRKAAQGARIVSDAGGSMNANASTRREKFADGQASRIEPEWYTVEEMRTIAAARVRSSRNF